MTPALLRKIAIRPALCLLPEKMRSPEAEALLLAVAYQESNLEHRAQVPSRRARGFWQFERGGGVYGVLQHVATSGPAVRLCKALDVEPSTQAVYLAIEYQDVLAAGLARLLLWTLPQPLPVRDDPVGGWEQYLAAWRPGRPRVEAWRRNYDRAWEAMT